jgi:hypothetical protein
MNAETATKQSDSQSNRWIQLLLGLVAMMTISSPQYVWTLFTGPLNQKLGVFILVACLDALTALLAITALKRMRRSHFEAAS